MSANRNYAAKPAGYHKNSKGYNPRTYISIQDKVNGDPSFRASYFNNIAEQGWGQLEDPTDILKAKPGTQIKYRLAQHKREPGEFGFKSGGFYVGPGQNREYISYRGFNGVVFNLQLVDVEAFYIKQK